MGREQGDGGRTFPPMADRFFIVWDSLRTSLWFVPAVMVAGATALAFWTPGLRLEGTHGWWLHSGGPEDARNLVGTLLGAMITMTTLVFSITMVVVTLAAQQFGSRLVRSFMAEPGTQFVLGLFLSTITFLLLVLRMIRQDMTADDLPHLSVTIGSFMALACILALPAFVHMVAQSIVGDEVVERVHAALTRELDRLLVPPVRDAAARRPPEPPAERRDAAAKVALDAEGYVQAVAFQRLVRLASRRDLEIRLEFRAGDYLVRDNPRILVWPAERCDGRVSAAIRRSITVSGRRTPAQDPEFSFRHLVEVGVRALSPGINDDFTALAALDRIGAALAQVFDRTLRPAIHCDAAGTVRVTARAPDVAALVNFAFNQIRQAGSAKPAIILHIQKVLGLLADHVRLPEHLEALETHMAVASEAGLRLAREPFDRKAMEIRRNEGRVALDRARRRLECTPDGAPVSGANRARRPDGP